MARQVLGAARKRLFLFSSTIILKPFPGSGELEYASIKMVTASLPPHEDGGHLSSVMQDTVDGLNSCRNSGSTNVGMMEEHGKTSVDMAC